MKTTILLLALAVLGGCQVLPAPHRPEGPSTGLVGQRLNYTTEGTDPLDVHDFQYDWGDGVIGKWKDDVEQSHVYTVPGTYEIRVQEKCPLDVLTSPWSKALAVTIKKVAAGDSSGK